jgi:hypothetical protein
MILHSESVPVPQSPEEPPLAPYDPPEPAPQAIAWRRALQVVAGDAARRAALRLTVRIGPGRLRGNAVGQS